MFQNRAGVLGAGGEAPHGANRPGRLFDVLLVRFPIWSLRVILALVLFVAPFVNYATNKRYLVHWQPLLIPAVLVVGAALPLLAWVVARRVPSLVGRRFVPVVLAGGVALLVTQILLVRAGVFVTGWDVGYITTVGDRANAETLSALGDYLSSCPNNALPNVVCSIAAAIGAPLGINAYASCVAGGCVCVTISVVACTFAARRVFGERVALAFDLVASLYLGLNGWIFVPYTDTYGMLCPSLALACVTCVRDARLRAVLVGLLAAVGYAIKPTAVFVGLACVALAFPRVAAAVPSWFGRMRASRFADVLRALARSRAAQAACCGALAFTVGLCVCSAVTAARCRELGADPAGAMGIPHYLMMGANASTMGGFNGSDVAFSQSFDDPGERSVANLSEWVSRIGEMGPMGVAKLGVRKILTNFADGTFAWECEGRFYRSVPGNSTAVKAWYGIGEGGASTTSGLPYELLCQAVWLFVLAGCAVAPRDGGSATERVARLSLLMLALFLTVFEARARYVFLFAPYFVLLGVVGWFRAGAALERLLVGRLRAARDEVAASKA